MAGLREKLFGSGQKMPQEALVARLYSGVVERTAGMVGDAKAQALAARHGSRSSTSPGGYRALQGRGGSVVGPNTSDRPSRCRIATT